MMTSTDFTARLLLKAYHSAVRLDQNMNKFIRGEESLRSLTIFLILLSAIIPAGAEKRPNAGLKAEYECMSKTINTKTGDTIVNLKNYVLQIGQNESFYFDPQTQFVDSLKNDPNGSAMLEQARYGALQKAMSTGESWFEIEKEMGISRGSLYKNSKDFLNGKITVWDSNMGNKYRYDVEMDDLVWELGDSVKNVMGYECQLASADYHGRKWMAWFSTELPIADGPWQLCGLPGLIMEAVTEDGEYGFSIKGLQECDEPMKDPYEHKDIFKSKRITVLRMKDYSRRNRAAQIGAMTKGAVKLKETEYKENIDFIETDYHE